MNKIITVKGSITDTQLLKKHNTRFIAHCANCFCVMGAGVAAAISKEFPYAADADKKTKRGDLNKLGDLSVGIPREGLLDENPIVFNLYGQYDLGSHKRQLNYEMLYRSLELMHIRITADLRDYGYFIEWENGNLAKHEIITIGFPYKIGCGLAGGSWIIVDAMIREVFKGRYWNNNILIYDIENK